jgi:hypothetical protein
MFVEQIAQLRDQMRAHRETKGVRGDGRGRYLNKHAMCGSNSSVTYANLRQTSRRQVLVALGRGRLKGRFITAQKSRNGTRLTGTWFEIPARLKMVDIDFLKKKF